MKQLFLMFSFGMGYWDGKIIAWMTKL